MSTNNYHDTSFITRLTDRNFDSTALSLFRYQYSNNPVYNQWVNALNIDPELVSSLDKIPFLPIRFYRTHAIQSGKFDPQATFISSGTTSDTHSRRPVQTLAEYDRVVEHNFKHFYGNPDEYCILALLPSYSERGNSSLIYMVNHLMGLSGNSMNGYFLYNHQDLNDRLAELEESGQKTLLIGVSFALLDFVSEYKINLRRTIVMETGGMKGRRKEITREELHETLKNGFDVDYIHSEYGMTELFSQAYSNGQGIFRTPTWMKILTRDIYDPFSMTNPGRPGIINVIDLANIDSCSFVATDDIGICYEDQSFEVKGRMDMSDVRGCNLMI